MRIKLNVLIAAVAVAPLWGCGSKRDGSPAPPQRRAAATSRPDWLVVETDAEALRGARQRAAKQETDEFEAVFAGLGSTFGYIDLETIDILNRRPDEAKRRLKALLPEDGVTDRSVGAAMLLCRLRMEDGRAFAVRILEGGSAAQRVRVLDSIDSGLLAATEDEETAYRRFVVGHQRLAAALLRQLDDEDAKVVEEAIQACGILEVPGADGKFLALLRRPVAPDRGRLLYWLSKGPLTEELLRLALQHSKEAGQETNYGPLSLLEAYAKHDDPALRRPARDELKRLLAVWPDEGGLGYRGDRLGVLQTLAKTSGPDDLAWLTETFHRERGMYAQPLLAAGVRLEGDAGRRRLLGLLNDPKRRYIAVQVAGEVFSGSGDTDIVSALASLADECSGRELYSLCQSLLAIGGDEAKRHLAQHVGRLDDTERAHIQGELDRPALDQTKAAVAKSGLLDAAELAAAVERLNKASQRDPTRVPGLLDLLAAANRAIMFDAETGMLPCRHDRLVQDFARYSQGLFQPTAVTEQWHQRDEEDYEADYTLRFIHDGRLYMGRLRNFGDWYDVERTVFMVNAALVDSNRSERFVALATGDQTASFVFADPSVLAPLAQQFHMPLSDDPTQAMEKGLEFERRVFEELKKQDQ